eukprot:TRINITY_DN103611_c0_g1_i1.p1 TRINITY_DN103611_c0_g1~~TRINITY_DN103611_c0_g1_i1.p1  ORF type:complete len:401 (+),score=67.06 TRINITY_DN103611_c0_g1_i1:21-1223(+)
MADDDRQPQPRLVVHNTFLEFDDHAVEESETVGRRPRAQTDITETKLPRKVSYHVDEPAQTGPGVGHMGKLGSVPEVGQDFPGYAGSASDPVFAAAAAAAGFPPPFPGMPPAYFPGLSPGGAWPPWGHPQAYLPSPEGVLSQSPLAGGHSAVWPYPPMPGFPGMPSPTAAEFKGHAAFPCSGQSPIGHHSQTLQKGGGRGRGGRLQHAPPVFRSKAGQAGDGITALSDEPAAKAAASNATLAQPPPPVNGTTIMLRNLPNRYSQQLLLELLDIQGFQCKYDFVYLPMDFRNGVNLGYAFVNLLSHQDALRAIEIFQGFGNWDFDSAKVCEVSWAHPHQGLSEHVERYRNSPVMHPTTPEEYKPMIFQNGIRMPFPAPTKAIRAPKLKLVPPGGGPAAAVS